MTALAQLPTASVYAQARAALAVRGAVGARLGWDVGDASSMLQRLDAAMARVNQVLSSGARWPMDTARGLLIDSVTELRQLAQDAVRSGVTTAADAALILADRAAAAAARLGDGAGEAFRSFWGISPSGGIGALLVVGLLVATGGGYLLLTPGGQAVLTSAGKALGPALAKGLL